MTRGPLQLANADPYLSEGVALNFMLTRILRSAPHIGAMSLLCALFQSGWAVAQAPGDAAPPSDEKVECIAAFEQAQVKRATSHLIEAQKHLLDCSRPTCGNALMTECTQMYTEVERALPSVVLSARVEGSHVDLSAVEVLIDGRPFAVSLDGRPIPVNPGEYELTFNAPGYPALRRRVVIGTGDKYRQVSVVIPAPQPALPEAVVVPSAPAPRDPTGVPVMSYVLGGVGVAGLGTFAVLRIIANGDFDTLKEGCASQGCPSSDISTLRQKYLFSHIALGTGVAAAAGAVLWYVIDGSQSTSSEQDLTVGFEPVRGGGLTTAAGRF